VRVHDRQEDSPLAPGDTAALLAAARGGDRAAYDRVFAHVYAELRRIASRQAARFSDSSTLSTTALVHETYLKLAGDRVVAAADREHFFALAARAMRQILIDHARGRTRQKRGGGAPHVSIDRVALPDDAPVDDLLALDQALGRLEGLDPDLARLVEWRFFAGLTLAEIADLTAVSERTVKRDWQVARAFLVRELGGSSAVEGPV
jgi:RNA polymerase sigma factor (TIGR02999 family)